LHSIKIICVFFPILDFTKLLVASVKHVSDGEVLAWSNVKIFNLDNYNPDLVCDNLPKLLIGAKKASGKLFKGKIPIICGGYDENCRCQAFQNGLWDFIPDPPECKNVMDSAILTHSDGKEVFFISGSESRIFTSKPYCREECIDEKCYTTCVGKRAVQNEFFFTAKTYNGIDWNNYISEKLAFADNYCIVKIDSSTIFSIGGVGDTFFYNFLDGKWTSGPYLNETRYDFSCGILLWRNPESRKDEKVVVVAGGNGLSSVELLFLNDLSDESEWISGPELPTEIDHSTLIEYKNSLILIGGNSEEVYKLPDNMLQLSSPKGPWTEMSQPFIQGKGSHVAFLVPDEIVNCHN